MCHRSLLRVYWSPLCVNRFFLCVYWSLLCVYGLFCVSWVSFVFQQVSFVRICDNLTPYIPGGLVPGFRGFRGAVAFSVESATSARTQISLSSIL